ncbi:MAG: DUF6941 family protein [Candidatus Xenobia bacterium]
MHADFAFICDWADNAGHKIHALGIGFDAVYANNVPARHPCFYFVAQVRASALEAKPTQVAVKLIDPDGKELTRIPGTIDFQKPEPGEEARCKIAVCFLMQEFPRYGDYEVQLEMAEQLIDTVPLRIVQTPGN